MKIRIAICEDHQAFRKTLVNLINLYPEFEVIAQSSNGQELIPQLVNSIPHIVLLDINMPIMNGYETATYIASHYPSIKMICISMFDNTIAIDEMKKAGIHGFLSKNVNMDDLQSAIYAVLNNLFYTNVNKHLNAAPLYNMQGITALTKKEKEVIQLLCSEKSYKDIAKDLFVSTRTVERHRENVFKKLKVSSRANLILFANKTGLINMY